MQQIAIVFYGGRENPSEILKAIKLPHRVAFTSHPDKDDTEETAICFVHPKKYGYSGNLSEYMQWVAEFLEKESNTLAAFGLGEINLWFDFYFDSDYASTEILNAEMLEQMHRLKMNSSIAIELHKLSIAEMEEMLREEGFDESTYRHMLS